MAFAFCPSNCFFTTASDSSIIRPVPQTWCLETLAYEPYALPTHPPPKPRHNLTFAEKLQVIEFYHAHKHLHSMEAMVAPLREMGFSTITQSSISRILKAENRIRNYVATGGPAASTAKREALVTLPEVEEALLRWIESEGGIKRVKGEEVIAKGRELCETMGVEEWRRIKFSKGWLVGFKKRNGLIQARRTSPTTTSPTTSNNEMTISPLWESF